MHVGLAECILAVDLDQALIWAVRSCASYKIPLISKVDLGMHVVSVESLSIKDLKKALILVVKSCEFYRIPWSWRFHFSMHVLSAKHSYNHRYSHHCLSDSRSFLPVNPIYPIMNNDFDPASSPGGTAYNRRSPSMSLCTLHSCLDISFRKNLMFYPLHMTLPYGFVNVFLMPW